EHNLELVACADWVIDMGPEGGDGGGLVVAEGTPEEVAACKGSHTGAALREILESLRDSVAAEEKKSQRAVTPTKPAVAATPQKKPPALPEAKATKATAGKAGTAKKSTAKVKSAAEPSIKIAAS